MACHDQDPSTHLSDIKEEPMSAKQRIKPMDSHHKSSGNSNSKHSSTQIESPANNTDTTDPTPENTSPATEIMLTNQTRAPQPLPGSSSPSDPPTTRLLSSLLSIPTYTPKLHRALHNPYPTSLSHLPLSATLLEATRLANQLVEDLITFDISGQRIQYGIPRLPLFRTGVDARAFVELWEGFNRDCIDGVGREEVVDGKEAAVRERRFWEFWCTLEGSVGGLVGYLVQGEVWII